MPTLNTYVAVRVSHLSVPTARELHLYTVRKQSLASYSRSGSDIWSTAAAGGSPKPLPSDYDEFKPVASASGHISYIDSSTQNKKSKNKKKQEEYLLGIGAQFSSDRDPFLFVAASENLRVFDKHYRAEADPVLGCLVIERIPFRGGRMPRVNSMPGDFVEIANKPYNTTSRTSGLVCVRRGVSCCESSCLYNDRLGQFVARD
ncbi:hypothetical protein F5Y19DRAFT_485171 [Xylariaceae sp. FL1651]|nr:hypothetical protein F5Y19DRAFT_485171 [Xylariaceae sp. FL1651]